MMNKTEIKAQIDSTIHKLKLLQECLPEESQMIKIETFNELYKWLETMASDVDSGYMPEHHYEKASDDLNSLSLNQIGDDKGSLIEKLKKDSQLRIISDLIKRINNAITMASSYDVLRTIDYAQENCVIVGPNGCGKTTLANTFTNGITKSTGIVIPAQKLLIAPNIVGIANPDEVDKQFQNFQKEIKNYKQTYLYRNTDDVPYDIVKFCCGEFRNVLLEFLADWNRVKNLAFIATREHRTTSTHTKFDEAKGIWNELMHERKLDLDENDHFILTFEGKSYPVHLMSEGEKEILYLIGRVLFAPKDGYIIVDEPEIYLHKTIVNKLWDKLEQKRQDCKFIYLTHDLDFAATRHANKYWIKRFHHPQKWEIQALDESEIPEELLLTILGSRKKILFCEGTKDSKDAQIFEILFPQFTITPVGSCNDVINFTKAFNKVNGRLSDAYGIIDHDFRTDEELEKLRNQNVYSYGVAEVENILLVENLISAYSQYSHLQVDVNAIKKKILLKFDGEKEKQASSYVASRLNYEFSKDPIDNEKTISEVENRFQNFVNKINVMELYNNRLAEINTVISENDYSKAILLYNNKGLHSIVSTEFSYKKYQEAVLDFIRDDENARRILVQLFPLELCEI